MRSHPSIDREQYDRTEHVTQTAARISVGRYARRGVREGAAEQTPVELQHAGEARGERERAPAGQVRHHAPADYRRGEYQLPQTLGPLLSSQFSSSLP